MSSRLLEETDKRRRHLAQRFVAAGSPSERFAISKELGRLLDVRRSLSVRADVEPTSWGGWSHTATSA